MGKKRWAFVMDRFEKLRDETIFWNSIRESVKEKETPDRCFCDGREQLSLEHLFPRTHGGPDEEKNMAWVCRSCNSSKGGRRPYEYWTLRGGMEAAKYDMPRLVEGKYLKFLFETLSTAGSVDWSFDQVETQVCPSCDLSPLCRKVGSFHNLSPLCLDGVTTLALANTRTGN
jgi:hypothetical protein